MPTFSANDSISKLSLMAMAAFGFVVLGLWVAGIFGEPPKPGREWFGWICALFFGLMGSLVLGRLSSPSEQVRISRYGICYRQWSDDTIPWSEIANVSVWRFKGQKCILLNLQNADKFPSKTVFGKLAGVNRALTGGDIALNMAGTDKSFDDAMAAIDYFLSVQHAEVMPVPTSAPIGFGKKGL